MSGTELKNNGWAAVPRSHTSALKEINKGVHAKLDLDSVKVPDTDLAKKVLEYAKSTLPERTFNHCMRVWTYGKCRQTCYVFATCSYPHIMIVAHKRQH